MGMTPKVQDEQDLVRGHLEAQHDSQEALVEYQGKQTQLLAQLSAQIERSRERGDRDPVLIKHQQSEGEDARTHLHPGQRLRPQIVAEAIRRAPILDAYLAHKAGRKRLSDTYYEFTNRSRARLRHHGAGRWRRSHD